MCVFFCLFNVCICRVCDFFLCVRVSLVLCECSRFCIFVLTVHVALFVDFKVYKRVCASPA